MLAAGCIKFYTTERRGGIVTVNVQEDILNGFLDIPAIDGFTGISRNVDEARVLLPVWSKSIQAGA
jgi:hypothetical protein